MITDEQNGLEQIVSVNFQSRTTPMLTSKDRIQQALTECHLGLGVVDLVTWRRGLSDSAHSV